MRRRREIVGPSLVGPSLVGPCLARLSLALALAAGGCASDPRIGPVAPTAAERAAAEAAGYEVGPVRPAAELLPAALIAGPHHTVRSDVITHAFANHYWIASDFGDFEVSGDDLLRTRVAEIEALAAMQEMSKTAEFASAAARALKSPFVATWNLITNPVDTITGIPLGAWETVVKTARLARGDRGELEDSRLTALIGFEAKKRQIASQLGVDPYTSNAAVQKQLNRFAWAAYAGGLPFMFVPFVDDEDLDGEPEEVDRLTGILRDYSPEDLARLNRIELAVMGIPEPLRDEFVGHPWYSPRHETVLVEALAALDLTADRAEFIRVAVTAESEDEARFYQRTAELMRTYNERVAEIQRIVSDDGALMGYTESGALILPLAADHAVWDASTAALAGALAKPLGDDLERAELVLSGSLSPLARDRIEALGVSVTEHGFERLGKPGDPD